jgi:hypothetical protein
MRIGTMLCCGFLLPLAACGGGATSGPDGRIWAGSLTVTAAGTAGNPCATSHPVTFRAGGADTHALTLGADDCIEFRNADAAPHQPESVGTRLCVELDAPGVIAPGASWSTPAFHAAGACQWQDALNPVPTGGGSGY